jgi:hypothetical protein
MKNIRLLSLLAVLLCSGCIWCPGCGDFVDVKRTVDAYIAAQPCCSSFAELQYQDVTYPAKLSFSIDESSPLFDFGERVGKSRFAAFKLPEVAAPYRLELRSYFMRGGFTDAVVFIPLVTFLDADKKPLYTSNPVDLHLSDNLFTDEPLKSVRLQYVTEVVPSDPRYATPARYVVIHTSAALIASDRAAPKAEPVRVAASTVIPLVIPTPGATLPQHWIGVPVGEFTLRLEEKPKP